jgi:phospholipid/cholesterol/gamma-HCH transport system ATP-binding protein
MVTHDLTTLFTICSRIAVLVDRKVTVDTADKLMKSDHPGIQEFFHGPRAVGAMKARTMHHGN